MVIQQCDNYGCHLRGEPLQQRKWILRSHCCAPNHRHVFKHKHTCTHIHTHAHTHNTLMHTPSSHALLSPFQSCRPQLVEQINWGMGRVLVKSLLPPWTLGLTKWVSAPELHMILEALLLVMTVTVWAGQGLQGFVPVFLSLVVNVFSFVLST